MSGRDGIALEIEPAPLGPVAPEAAEDGDDAEGEDADDAADAAFRTDHHYDKASDVPEAIRFVQGWRCAFRTQRPEEAVAAKAEVLRKLTRKRVSLSCVEAHLPKNSRRHSHVVKVRPKYLKSLERQREETLYWKNDVRIQ